MFLWKIGVHDHKEKVLEMRRWNEALVTNMLPEHVAKHFLGSKKRDEVCKDHSHAGRWHVHKMKLQSDVKKREEPFILLSEATVIVFIY